MMNKICHILLAAGLYTLPFSLAAQAQVHAPTEDVQSSYAQLTSLNDQIALLKAQLQIAQLQQQLAVASHSSTTVQSGVPAFPSSVIPPPTFTDTTQNIPQILSISGRGKRLSAILQMPQGNEITVVPGTTLEDGAIVRYITPQTVMILLNNKTLYLAFSGTTHMRSGAP